MIVALLGLCIWGNEAFADNTDPQVGTQAKGTYFKAVVLDSLTKEPIEFATLHAKYVGDKQPRKYALTDENGIVVLQGLPVGRATITFEFMGYKPKNSLSTSNAEPTSTANFLYLRTIRCLMRLWFPVLPTRCL